MCSADFSNKSNIVFKLDHSYNIKSLIKRTSLVTKTIGKSLSDLFSRSNVSVKGKKYNRLKHLQDDSKSAVFTASKKNKN